MQQPSAPPPPGPYQQPTRWDELERVCKVFVFVLAVWWL
jgi:hypothetical protein